MALKPVVLESAIPDLVWFRVYHRDYFPEGMTKANQRFEKCIRLLCEHPNMGQPAGKPPRKRFSVPDTPYTIVYQQRNALLEVVRVLDQRKETYLKDLFDT